MLTCELNKRFLVRRYLSATKSCTLFLLQAPRGTDLRQRALRMPRGHLRPGNKGEGCPGFRECLSYCYVWVPSLHLLIFQSQRKDPLCGFLTEWDMGSWRGTVQSRWVAQCFLIPQTFGVSCFMWGAKMGERFKADGAISRKCCFPASKQELWCKKPQIY